MGALEVGKLDNFQILRCRTAVRAVGAKTSDLARLLEGLLAKRKNIVQGKDVFAVRKRKEIHHRRLLLSRLVGQQDGNSADALGRVFSIDQTSQMRLSS